MAYRDARRFALTRVHEIVYDGWVSESGHLSQGMQEMNGIELGAINYGGDKAVAWVTGRLGDAGLRVYCSFDLRSARNVSSSCACPYHRTDACDCQMVVLLVYQEQGSPATVVLHGHQGRTWLQLVDAPSAEQATAIEDALVTTHAIPVGVEQG